MVLIGGKHCETSDREILQYLVDHPDMTTRAAVEFYFSQFLFSLEKHEWSQLTDIEKQSFVATLDAYKGRPPKGPWLGDNKPTSK